MCKEAANSGAVGGKGGVGVTSTFRVKLRGLGPVGSVDKNQEGRERKCACQ